MVKGSHLGYPGIVVFDHNLCINYPGVHDFAFSLFLSVPVSQIRKSFGQIVSQINFDTVGHDIHIIVALRIHGARLVNCVFMLAWFPIGWCLLPARAKGLLCCHHAIFGTSHSIPDHQWSRCGRGIIGGFNCFAKTV